MMARNTVASALCSLLVLVFLTPLTAMLNLGLRDDRYVTVIAVPAIFVALMYWDRRRIFGSLRWEPAIGPVLIAIALSAWFVLLQHNTNADPDINLTFAGLTIVLAGAGAFMLCWGRKSLAAAAFPFCCLLLAVPLPATVMDRITAALQYGSAATSVTMLRFFGVPVFAQDTYLSLPGLYIQVAPECSGIHSCLSLLLITIVVSRVGLRSNVSRVVLVLSTIPLAIVKNAFRISVIAMLSAYVDHSYINSPIHRYGGFIFTPLQIAILGGLLYGLRKLEGALAPDPPANLPPTEVIETNVLAAD
jgi:exosortase